MGSETKTYTFKVDVVKTDSDNKVLDGAQFKLYDAKTGGKEIALVKVPDGVYRLAEDGETGVEYITTVNGQLEIKGFDANTNYYLEETKAPDGYNKLAERVEIAVKEDESGSICFQWYLARAAAYISKTKPAA